MQREALIILDLNGTLMLRKKDKVYLRKNLSEFKNYCFSVADVAIYTSMMSKNIKLAKYFTDDEINKLIFVWDRKKTRPDKDGTKGWETIKSLESVYIEYPNYKNVIIIDDSNEKLRYIPTNNKIIVPSFTDEKEEDNILLDIMERIKLYELCSYVSNIKLNSE